MIAVGGGSITARDSGTYLGALQSSSGAVLTPTSASQQSQPLQLSLFDGLTAPCKARAAGPQQDEVAFAGGPVWALDWCPEQHGDSLHLAVAAHPKEREHNPMAPTPAGPVILQLWSIPASPQLQKPATPIPSPRRDPCTQSTSTAPSSVEHGRHSALHFDYGIAFEGGIVRDCRWCPSKQEIAGVLGIGQLPATRLGLLAILLGTGEIQVLWVPHVSAVPPAAQAHSQDGRAAEARVVTVQPAAAASVNALGGSCPSCLEWLPCAPHDLMLVGCFDGTAAMLRMLPTSSASPDSTCAGMQPLLHFAADADPIRAVAWAHPSICSHTSDHAGRHLFATAGNSSHAQIWDARDPAQAVAKIVVPGRTWILALVWEPLGLLAVQDDGSLHILNVAGQSSKLDSNIASFIGDVAGAMWDVHQHPQLGHTAYTGADGEVLIAPRDFQLQRMRPAHKPVAGFRQEGDVLKVCTAAEIARTSGAFAGRNVASAGTRVASAREAIHRVRWKAGSDKDGSVAGAWLAHAGAEGLLRCQYLAFV